MPRELLEHDASPAAAQRSAAWRRTVLEKLFGDDPEDWSCAPPPVQASPKNENVHPDAKPRRRGGVPDEKTGPRSHPVHRRLFSNGPGWARLPLAQMFCAATREERTSLHIGLRDAANGELLRIREAHARPVPIAAIRRIGRRKVLHRCLSGFAKRPVSKPDGSRP